MKIFEKSISETKIWMMLGALSGGVFFIVLCGTSIINPLEYEWIFNRSEIDASIPFFGWLFYEQTPWEISFFSTYDTTYPYECSIVFQDIIVPAAVLCRLLFARLIPSGCVTQYLGIWGMLCYILQGMFAGAAVAGVMCENRIVGIWLRLAGLVLFITSPPMMQRLFDHNSLTAHWLILAGICLFLYRNSFKKGIRYFFWAALVLTGTSVHVYFFPMLVLMMGISFICEAAEDKKIKDRVLVFMLTIFLCTAQLAVLGVFTSKIAQSAPESRYKCLYQYSSNLLAMVNPLDNSLFLPRLPQGGRQYEGYGYLGLGGVLLLILSFIGTAVNAVQKYLQKDTEMYAGKQKEQETGTAEKRYLLILAVTAFIIAVGPVVTLGPFQIFAVPVPHIFEHIYATFSSFGRFIWIADYALITLLLCSARNHILMKNSRISAWLAVFITVLQIADLTPAIQSKRKIYVY